MFFSETMTLSDNLETNHRLIWIFICNQGCFGITIIIHQLYADKIKIIHRIHDHLLAQTCKFAAVHYGLQLYTCLTLDTFLMNYIQFTRNSMHCLLTDCKSVFYFIFTNYLIIYFIQNQLLLSFCSLSSYNEVITYNPISIFDGQILQFN